MKDLRSYFRNNYLKNALLMGMTEELFWQSNPKRMKTYIDAYKERQLIQDNNNWSLGLYIKAAIASAMDKHNKYPEKSFLQEAEDNRVVERKDLTEDETELARRRMMMQMGLPKALLDEE